MGMYSLPIVFAVAFIVVNVVVSWVMSIFVMVSSFLASKQYSGIPFSVLVVL